MRPAVLRPSALLAAAARRPSKLRLRLAHRRLCSSSTSTAAGETPPLPVRAASLGLSWGLPCEGTLGEVLTLTLRVVNASKELKALRLSYSENDAFLFCGLKLFHFRLPPSFSHTLTFNLVPIRSGAVPLPLPRLLDVNANVELVDPNARHRVFVRPCAPPPAAWAEPRLAPAAENAASVS